MTALRRPRRGRRGRHGRRGRRGPRGHRAQRRRQDNAVQRRSPAWSSRARARAVCRRGDHRPAGTRICRRGISRTFQLTALFPEMSARENARLAAQARQRVAGSRSAAPQSSRRRGARAMQRSSSSASTHVANRPAGLLSARRPAAARGRHGHGAAAARAAARRADAGALGRGDGPGGRDAGAVPGQASR